MLGKTHLAGGLAAATVICHVSQFPIIDGLVFIAGCAVGSLIPDIDHKSSIIGKKVKPVSTVISMTTKHRTLFHWFAPYCLLAAAIHYWRPDWDLATLSVLIGILTHIGLDALNPAGVPFFPGIKLHLAKIRTGSKLDKSLGILLSLLATGSFLYWIIGLIS